MRNRMLLPGLTVLILLVATALSSAALYQSERSKFEALLHSRAINTSLALNEYLAHSTYLVESTATTLALTPEVSYLQFLAAVSSQAHGSLPIPAIGWAPIIPASQRHTFQQTTERALSTEVTLKRWDGANWKADSSSWSEHHTPIQFIAPLKGQQNMLGIDLASHPAHGHMLERAHGHNGLFVNPRLTLPQQSTKHGALWLAPSPAEPTPHGFVVGIIEIAALVQQLLLSHDTQGLGLRLTDNTQSPIELYQTPMPGSGHADDWQYEHFLQIGDRTWRLEWYADSEYRSAYASVLPWLLLWLGSLVSVVFGGLLYQLRQQTTNSAEHGPGARLDIPEPDHHLLDVITDTFPHVFLRHNLDTALPFHSSMAIATLLEYPSDEWEALSRQWQGTLIHTKDVEKLLAHRQTLMQLEEYELTEIQYRIRAKSGSWKVLVERAAVYQRDSNAKVHTIIGSTVDITVQTRSAEKFSRQAISLKSSNEDLQRYVFAASHDLQEPLRAISGYLQLVQEKHGEQLQDEAQRYLSKSIEGATRMHRLINDLLEYSQLRQSETPMGAIDIRGVVDQVLEDIHHLTQETQADIRITALPNVLGNSSQLSQLFSNMLINAIKYHRPGIAPQIEISSRTQGVYAIIDIRDNGIGIEPVHHDKVFELFVRLQHRSHSQGTGIGLAICKRVAEFHCGKIELHSTPGKGSCFSVFLHLAPEKMLKKSSPIL